MTAIGDSKLFKKRLGDFGVNVYQGCEHGCRFCYAPAQPGVRAQPFWKGKSQADWGTVFMPRPGLLDALVDELRTFTPAAAQKKATPWGEGRILVSFLCDPYQPLELKEQNTRRVLEALLEAGHKVRIQTRSDLVMRDFELLAKYPAQVRLGTSLPHLNDELSAVLEPKAPSPSKRLIMLNEASKLGIPVYVAIAPFMPFHTVTVLDEVVQAILPLKPTEIFCEPLNPKGHAVEMVLAAIAERYPAEAALIHSYDDAAWAQWTYKLLAFGVSKYADKGFIAWPDTGRAWAKHLSGPEAAFLEQFLPPSTVADNPKQNEGGKSLTPGKKAWVTMRKKYTPDQIHQRASAAAKKAHQTMRRKLTTKSTRGAANLQKPR